MEIFEAGIDDVLSYLQYQQPHRTRISSTNPTADLRLIAMLLIEKNSD